MSYPIPEDVYRLLQECSELSLRGNGQKLAERAGIPARSARRYAKKFRNGEAVPRKFFGVESVEFTGARSPTLPLRFTGHLKLDGDFLIINDVHIPATNWQFAQKVLDVAQKYSIRKLIIAGDLINGDAVSRWDDLVVGTSLADEIEYAEKYLTHLAMFFDEIWFSRGNHENRILLTLKGQLNAPQFLKMITNNSRVKFSIYSYIDVLSGGVAWRITHQTNYSRNPLTVARVLATKLHANTICAHQHHSAIGRSVCNQYSCIDSGGLHDHKLMAYVQLDDNTSPVMNNGFVMLKNGVATLFTPYNTTDWEQWLED